jgi:hypothetical protein
MISHLSSLEFCKLTPLPEFNVQYASSVGYFFFDAWELSCFISSAPIRAWNVVCCSVIGDQEILTIERVGGGRVRAKDFRPSYRTVQTCLSLSKLTKRKKERTEEGKKERYTTMILLMVIIHCMLLTIQMHQVGGSFVEVCIH